MKVILKGTNQYIVRFDKEEDVIEILKEWAITEKITAGFFTGIGATADILLSFYHLESKMYRDLKITTACEIVNLQGNIAMSANETVIHAHGIFSRQDFSTIGGHVKKLIVSATCEIMVTTVHGKMERSLDEEIGLKLLQ